MKRLVGLLLFAFLLAHGTAAQVKDWRQMQRRKIVKQVAELQLKDGANEVLTDPKGFKLFVLAKDKKITGWQARDPKGTRLKVTQYDYPASADDSKEPGKLKMIVQCVEAKEVCYEVQLVPVS